MRVLEHRGVKCAYLAAVVLIASVLTARALQNQPFNPSPANTVPTATPPTLAIQSLVRMEKMLAIYGIQYPKEISEQQVRAKIEQVKSFLGGDLAGDSSCGAKTHLSQAATQAASAATVQP